MNRMWWLPLVLLAAACGGGSSTNSEDNVILKLQNELELLDNRSRATYQTLGTQIADLNKRLTLLEGQIVQLSAQLADAEAKLKTGAASAPTPGNGGTGSAPDEAAITKTELTLKELKAGAKDETAAIRDLLPIAKVAAPLVLEDLKRNLFVPKYAESLEKIVSTMPLDAVRGPLQQMAKQKETRSSAARIIGSHGDTGLSRLLEEYLADAEEDHRLVLGEALVKCRNAAGLPPLVGLLRSEKWDVRALAVDALKKVNRGVDFGYNYRRSPAENAESLEKWETWLKEFGDKVFDP